MTMSLDTMFTRVIRNYENRENPGFFERWLKTRNGKVPKHFIPSSAIQLNPFITKMVEEELSFKMSAGTFMSVGYGWVYGKTIIDVSQTMVNLMMSTPPSDIIPAAWVDAIPGWTTYIPLKDAGNIDGLLLARRKEAGEDVLILGIIYDVNFSLQVCKLTDVGDGFISFQLPKWMYADLIPEEINSMKCCINTALFLCSMIPHNSGEIKVVKRTSRSKRVVYEIVPRKSKVINLHSEQEAYLKEYGTSESEMAMGERKAHMRRAHWHTYWTGPRTGEQTKVLRWIPPTFIKGFVTA